MEIIHDTYRKYGHGYEVTCSYFTYVNLLTRNAASLRKLKIEIDPRYNNVRLNLKEKQERSVKFAAPQGIDWKSTLYSRWIKAMWDAEQNYNGIATATGNMDIAVSVLTDWRAVRFLTNATEEILAEVMPEGGKHEN